MMKLLAIVAAIAVATNAISISWTGYANDNQWTNNVNWSPDQVPSSADDVTIASGVVLVTVPVTVNSLVMGTSFDAPANLTIFQSFVLGTGGLQVQGNGNLFINSGTANVFGQVTMGGNLYFQSGQISGQWQITSRGVADLSGPAQKVFSGCSFTSQASSFVFSGVMALNQSSQVVVQTKVVFSGDVSIQAQDTTSVLLDTSAGTLTYTGQGTLQIQAPWNVGTFNFLAGNLTIYDDVTFVNSFSIPSGSYVATVGSATASMTAGVTGAGVLSAAGSLLTVGAVTLTGAFNLVGGNVSFAAAGSNISIFTITGGFALINKAVSVSQLNFLNGNIAGSAGVTAKQLYFSTNGFNLNAAVTVTGTASMGGLLAFGSSGSLKFASTATFNTLASLTFTGVPGMTVTNNGVMNVVSPVVFQNINLAGVGTVTATSTLSIQTATVTQTSVSLSGAGVFKGANTKISSVGKVSAAKVVNAVIGSYTFTCPKECDQISTTGVPTSSFRFSA